MTEARTYKRIAAGLLLVLAIALGAAGLEGPGGYRESLAVVEEGC